jgi:hypothetical protein
VKKVLAAFALASVLAVPSLFASSARAVYTFDCTGTGNTALPNPPWVPVSGGAGNFSYYVTGTTCRTTDASAIHIAYYDDTFANDQYAQMALVDTISSTSQTGAAVRVATGADGYACRLDGYIVRFDDTSGFSNQTVLASGLTNAADGDVLRCEAEGTTIRRKINGVTEGSVTDATYASGKAGITGTAADQWDNWEGGDLGAATTCATCAKVNSPIRGGGFLRLRGPDVR